MSAKRQKSEQFSIRVSAEDMATIQQAATERGWTVTQFFRVAAIKFATGCAACGSHSELAWVVIKGKDRPTVVFGAAPFQITGAYRWAGWKCQSCSMRDHGAFCLPPRKATA